VAFIELVRTGGVTISGPALPGVPEAPCMRTFVTPGADVMTLVDARALALARPEFERLHRAHLELVRRTLSRWFQWLEALVWLLRIGGFVGLCAGFGVDLRATLANAVATTLALALMVIGDWTWRTLLAKGLRAAARRVLA
jgi:hypothetical protein